MRSIEARYENGLLKPETPLALQPGERVALIVVRHPDPRRWDLDRLAKAGKGEDLALAEQGLDDWADALDAEDHLRALPKAALQTKIRALSESELSELEIHGVASEATEGLKTVVGESRAERTQNVQDLLHCHAAFSRRLASLITEIDKALRDLVAFIPIWLEGVEKRRALLLKKELGGQQARTDELEPAGREWSGSR